MPTRAHGVSMILRVCTYRYERITMPIQVLTYVSPYKYAYYHSRGAYGARRANAYLHSFASTEHSVPSKRCLY